MKKFLLRITGLALLTGLLLTTSCTEDGTTDPGGGTAIPPLASLAAEAGFVSANAEVESGSVFSVKLRLQTGSSDLKSVRIQENNVNLPTSRFSINSGAIASNNPFLITGSSKTGVTYQIDIQVHDGFQETKTYTFQVTDDGNLTDMVSIEVTTKGEPVTTLTGVLFNQAGPTGTGGLDLDNGNGTGSTAAEAEIRDLGLDCTIPAPGLNWRRQIGSVNGADLRKVDLTKVENFTFANVTFSEQIIGAYDAGTTLADGESTNCANANKTNVTDVSAKLIVGDLFTVKKGDKYYLIRIDQINETAMNNEDNYVLSIKF